MDDPCYYGFPSFGEATIKAAEDCGGPVVDPDSRTFEPDPGMRERLADFVATVLPGSGPPVRSKRCQYTLTPDRDFVLDTVPGHPGVVVGLRFRARVQSSCRPSVGSWPTWPRPGRRPRTSGRSGSTVPD